MTGDSNQIFKHLPKFMKDAIEKEIEIVVDEQIENAIKVSSERIKARRAEMIAGVVLRMEKVVSMQTLNDNLIIKIQLTDKTDGTEEQG